MKNKSSGKEFKSESFDVPLEQESEFLREFHKMQGIDEDKEEAEEKSGNKADAKQRKNYIPDYEVFFEEDNTKNSGGAGILKRLFKQNFFKLIISTIFFVIKHAAIWVMPIVTSNIINTVTNSDLGTDECFKRILVNVFVLMLIILQNIPSHILYSRFTDKMLRTIGAGLRNTLIRKLQHLSITYHKEIDSGRIQAKFLRDIEAIEFFNTHFVKSVIPAIVSVFVAMWISISKSLEVTLFFICVIPVNVLSVYIFRKKISKDNKKYRIETESISAKVSSMLDMIPVTKAHGLEEQEIKTIESKLKVLLEKGLTLDLTNASFGSTSWALGQCISTLCLLFTSYLAIKGKIPVGDIVMYQTYFNMISGHIQSIVNIYPELAKGLESVQSVSEIMFSNDIENNKNKIRLRYVHGSVDFENVSYRYPNADKDTIKNFSLNVKKGECIAFVGGSGSGKSTIMNMIIGFLKATDGTLSIDGKPIEALSMNDYRHFISVVPQNSVLFDGTIRENILYGIESIDEARFQDVLEKANIKEFLPSLPNGLDTLVGENGGKLSGGQKQRISIARALIRDPKILILDEATSALDNISEYQVQKAMGHLIKERTTFIVAHRLSTIRDADRIVVMENGICVECGTYE